MRENDNDDILVSKRDRHDPQDNDHYKALSLSKQEIVKW